MIEQEIKANAPDGATHYDDSADYYVVKENSVVEIWTGEKWRAPVFNWDDELRLGIIKPL